MSKDDFRKVCIITGSATGLGAAIAKNLADMDWNVVINYTKSLEEAKETEMACRERGADTLLVQADISRDGDCRRMAESAMEKWGRIDALVNNAGVSRFASQSDLNALEAQDFHDIYAVNVIGTYQMSRAVEPHMKAAGQGSIVNVSSVAGVTGMGSSIAYAASKGALNTMTLSLARNLGPEIRVNAICPGMIQSRWLKSGLGEERYEKALRNYRKITPLQAASTPEDIAEAAVFFVTSGRHITGELLLVDAGMHLGFAPLTAR